MPSIWGGGGQINANAAGSILPQVFIANAGQVLFTLTRFTYTPGSNSLFIFVNGQLQVVGTDLTETSNSSFTLSAGCVAGDTVIALGFPLATVTQPSGLYAIQTSATGALVTPNGSTAQRDAQPVAGYFRWNNTLVGLEVFDGTNWGIIPLITSPTGSLKLPAGNTSQRDVSPSFGYIRANNLTNDLEWFNGVIWTSMTASAGSQENKIINGAQEIDILNNGAAVTPTTAIAYLTEMFGASLSQASKLTFQQVVDAPPGLKNSMKITVAAQYAPLATDTFGFLTAIEGKDVIDLQLGTAGATSLTLSNWIKGSVAGTYAVSLRNAATNRSYVGTVNVTTSWAQVKISIQGDITGTWLTDTGIGLQIWWDLGSGTNFQTTAGSWQAGNFVRTPGSLTFVNQVNGSTLNITGVDVRAGVIAPTSFERKEDDIALTWRYYEQGGYAMQAANSPGGIIGGIIAYKATKRIAPTVAGTAVGGTILSFNGLVADTQNMLGFQSAPNVNGQIWGSWTSSSRLF